MEEVKTFTEKLIMEIVQNPEIVKVQDFTDEDDSTILEIIVHSDDMGVVIGKSGSMAKAIRTLVKSVSNKANCSFALPIFRFPLLISRFSNSSTEQEIFATKTG